MEDWEHKEEEEGLKNNSDLITMSFIIDIETMTDAPVPPVLVPLLQRKMPAQKY